MPAANIGLLNGSPTAGGTDGVLVDAGNPIASPDFFTGADTIGSPVKLATRVLQDGYKRAGTFTISLLGATADRWALAPDVAGAPGAWGAWGAPLTLTGPITPRNTLFWIRSRALAAEVAGDDVLVVLSTPDDVTPGAPVGRSWVLPYLVGNIATVGRSWVLPYKVLTPVGRSWALPSNVLATVGRSWSLPYAIVASWTDDFNRADGSLGANWWTSLGVSSGTAGAILSNQLKMGGLCTPTDPGLIALFTGSGSLTNQKITAKVYGSGKNEQAGLVVRAPTQGSATWANGNGFYLAYLHSNGAGAVDGIALYKFVANGSGGGTYTQLGTTYSTSLTAGDLIGLEANGTTIKVTLNGTTIITQTDSTFSSGYAGFRQTQGNSPNPTVALWDDVTIYQL